jgi:hypothetical protein
MMSAFSTPYARALERREIAAMAEAIVNKDPRRSPISE